ncbi:MAG: hypothetical protein JNL80_14050 [Phycisphaerae bacterium]|nr:hypothetical protein [Phycisphaerae bacterium]
MTRVLILLCVLAQVAMTFVRSGDRVLCFSAQSAAECREHADPCDHPVELACHEHGSSIGTALPHDHGQGCCFDVKLPDAPSRTDQALGVPDLPPPALVAIIEIPSDFAFDRCHGSLPQVIERGIPPASGLRVIRIQV